MHGTSVLVDARMDGVKGDVDAYTDGVYEHVHVCVKMLIMMVCVNMYMCV